MAPKANPTTHTDAQFMATPRLWPHWPLLPVKKRDYTTGNFPKLGVMLAEDAYVGVLAVFHTDMYTFSKQAAQHKTLTINHILEVIEHTKYDSIDAIVADGWIVD